MKKTNIAITRILLIMVCFTGSPALAQRERAGAQIVEQPLTQSPDAPVKKPRESPDFRRRPILRFRNGATVTPSPNALFITGPDGHHILIPRSGTGGNWSPAHANLKLTERCMRLSIWLDHNYYDTPTWRRVCLDYFDHCEP